MTDATRERYAKKDSTKIYVAWLLLATVAYQWLLCLLQGFGLHVTSGYVAVFELLIYLGCLPLLWQKISHGTIVAALLLAGWIATLALFRNGYIDFKALRDVTIPLLFIWLGTTWRGSLADIDSILWWLLAFVIALGCVELIFFDTYTRFINTFQYYVNVGGINALAAQVEGQTVTLNGLRPEGIGRTVLPQLLGNHRASSAFLEPVSLGNFAVIVYAWGLCRPATQWRSALVFVVCALLMVALADSRFALFSMGTLALCRICVRRSVHQLAILLPIFCIAILSIVATYVPMGRDDLIGRLASSGHQLQQLSVPALFGIKAFTADFGDAGYAYVITRLGLIIAAVLWIALFFIPLPNEQAQRYRTLICVYIGLILCVSGTSVFALKTSALLWFLFGALAGQTKTDSDVVTARGFAHENSYRIRAMPSQVEN